MFFFRSANKSTNSFRYSRKVVRNTSHTSNPISCMRFKVSSVSLLVKKDAVDMPIFISDIY